MSADIDCGNISAWVEQFREDHGRQPKVLHIGNIANNGYRNAKFMRELGFECHVLCYDYFHALGTPEWDEASFDPAEVDQFFPDWTLISGKYRRPNWFIQGSHEDCFEYIEDLNSGSRIRCIKGWYRLGRKNKTRENNVLLSLVVNIEYLYKWIGKLILVGNPVLDVVSLIESWRPKKYSRAFLFYIGLPVILPVLGVVKALACAKAGACRFWSKLFGSSVGDDCSYEQRFKQLMELFLTAFPDRPDQLTLQDLLPYAGVYPKWCRALGHYDLIHAYATNPILPLLANKRPYVGFEHGTLRTFTFNDNQVSRLTSIGYYEADQVFITNGDCREYADRLNIPAYTPIPHPIDDRHDRTVLSRYEELHREHAVQYLFLCPLRHDWAIKGTDLYIRALPLIKANIGDSFRLLMTAWGEQVSESKALAESLGVDDLIVWLSPLNRHSLIGYIKSVDVVFDQIALPHFGATAPESIGVGTPVIMSYRPESTEWIIPEPAPILSAFSAEDIALAVSRALSPEWRKWFAGESERWFNAYHSWKCVAAILGKVYIKLIDFNDANKGVRK